MVRLKIYIYIDSFKEGLAWRKSAQHRFWEIHNSIFVFREKEVGHNLKIRALKNLKCHKNGQTCQENQNGKICVTMFLMNHQNNQPTKKVQWGEILFWRSILYFLQFSYHHYVKVLWIFWNIVIAIQLKIEQFMLSNN